MATHKNSCPTCKGYGVYKVQAYEGDEYINQWDDEFCDCETGQFHKWCESLAEELEEEFYIKEFGTLDDMREMCQCPEHVEVAA